MSADELSIEDSELNTLDVWPDGGGFRVGVNGGVGEHGVMHLTRGNAHLLFLYLRQHLDSRRRGGAIHINPLDHEQTK